MPAPPPAPEWNRKPVPEAEQQDPDKGMIEYRWAGRTIMYVGTVVHRYLQVMATEGTGRWNAGKIGGLRQGLPGVTTGIGGT